MTHFPHIYWQMFPNHRETGSRSQNKEIPSKLKVDYLTRTGNILPRASNGQRSRPSQNQVQFSSAETVLEYSAANSLLVRVLVGI